VRRAEPASHVTLGGNGVGNDRELQREINAAVNVAEPWNAGNTVIHYGKGGDIPGNRRDERELTVLCLRVLQASVP
jgi:TnpA family transposase